MMNILKAARNPQVMLQQMMQNNPQIKNIIDYINQNGGDPKQAFYAMAREKGVNPDEILNMLK
jgi:hemoglobin-like flavoprotein